MKIWKFLVLLLALGVSGAVLLAGINFLVLPSLVYSNKMVEVPDLRGLARTSAADVLEPLDLEVEVARVSAHPTFAEGTIIDQVPAPRTGVRGGRIVKVVVSSGPAAGTVPRLIGLSQNQAVNTIQRENYHLGRIVYLRRSGVTEAVVDFQDPAPGAGVLKGSEISLVVAEPAAARMMLMPDLRGMPLFRARQVIADAGFELGPIRSERNRKMEPNLVMAQRPEAGSRVAKGERLELVASSR